MARHETLYLENRAPLSDAARERTPGFYATFEECAARYPQLREAIRAGNFEASAALPLLTHGALLGVLGIRFLHPRVFDDQDRSLLLTLSELCAQALERARLFAAESEARAHAEAASRSKDEFLAMLGHELRNPLAPIVTALQLMKLRGDETLRKERAVIERQVTHLTRLVDDLLDVSRITRGMVDLKKERVEIAEVVVRATELSSARCWSSGSSTSRSRFPRRASPHWATRPGWHRWSPISSATRPSTRSRGDASRSLPRECGNASCWRCATTGWELRPPCCRASSISFPRSARASTDPWAGSALGLAIVKSLVTMHGGTVTAFSEGHGKGSVFTVELPAASQREAPASEAPRPPAPKATAHDRRVLVVDDNLDAAHLLAEVLRTKGHQVEVAHDGPAALRVASEFRPESALLDIGLPVMDGYELARRLRIQLGQVHLVAVTGYGQPADRARAHEAGFDAHLVKPVDLDALTAALQSKTDP